MLVRCKQIGRTGARAAYAAFTLIEVCFSVVMLALTMAGVIYGCLQANHMAEWSSMSLAAQSLASQGLEQARCALWNSQAWPQPTNSCAEDQLYVTNVVGATWTTNLSGTNYALDVPATGAPFYATNLITITCVCNTPPLRMIRSDCIWQFPLYGTNKGSWFTNSVVSYRAPDQ